MLQRKLFSLLCFVSAWTSGATQSVSSNSSMPTATIANGTIVGTTTSLTAATATVNKFLGIPFAQSPPQRFSPAQPAGALNGTFMAQTYAPACIQQFNDPPAVQNLTEELFNYPPPPSGESEDCLYLDVYAPSTEPPAGGRAVMFWIYGGSFQIGTGTLAAYNGAAFAAYNDVIVVTHNYRVNVFGFAAPSEIPASERNVGLLDQRMAMQWVQENIAAFGGDPSKVTIFGESAGAFSVDIHVTSFTTTDAPFRAAIMQSGQVSYSATNGSGSDNDASFQQLAQKMNCTGDALTCLRAAPATTIQMVIEQNALDFPPVVENYTYVANRAANRAAGRFAQVPTLIGTNTDEGRVFVIGQNNLTEYVQTTVGSVDPSLVPAVLEAFPTNATVSDYDQIARIFDLVVFQCAAGYLSNENFRQGVPTWRYLFNANFPNLSPFGGLLRVYHSTEIPLVFQTYAGGPVNPVATDNTTTLPLYLPPTPGEYALGSYMNAAWANFAKNPQLGPGWSGTGSFFGIDLGVLGGTTGTVAGVEMVNSTTVDAQCEVFRPLFEMFSGVELPE